MLELTALLDVRVLGLSEGPGAPASTVLVYVHAFCEHHSINS